jgi:hypothetical protein
MSQSTDYGSSGDLDDFEVNVLDDGCVYMSAPDAPIADATLPDSSQGSTYQPPIDKDSQSSWASTPAPHPPSDDFERICLGELETPAEKELDEEERRSHRVQAMRARCQSVRSDKTQRRSTHEDGQALALQILAKVKTKPEGWCRLSTAKPTSDKGYSQVSADGVNKFATLQELVLWAGGGSKPAHAGRTDPNDVSHLCDRPACTVPSHVVVETKDRNNARKGCVMSVKCSRKCRECNGLKDLLICPHVPNCVRFRDGFTSFEDYIENGVCEDRSLLADDRDSKRHRAC